MKIAGGPALPVVSSSGPRVQGGPALPVWILNEGDVSRPTIGKAAQRVKILTPSDLVGNGGLFRVEGRRSAVPIILTPSSHRIEGGPAIPVFPINSLVPRYVYGPELVLNGGFETAGGGGADIWANWIEDAGDGAIADVVTPAVGDDFERANTIGTLGTAPTGQTWALTGTGAAFGGITNGRMVCPSPYTLYAYLPYAYKNIGMGGEFSFVPGPGVDPQSVVMLANKTSNLFLNFIHFRIWATGWSLDISENGVWTYGLASGALSLAVDGTVYKAHMSIVGNTVTLQLPDGTTSSTTDARFDPLYGGYLTWEIVTTAVSNLPRWESVYVDGVHSGGHAAKLTRGTGDTTVYQNFAGIVPGRTHQATTWTRGDGTNAGRFRVYDVTNGYVLIVNEATGVSGTIYAQYRKAIVAPAGCVEFRVYTISPAVDDGIAYFDDVSVKERTQVGMMWSLP